MSEEDQPNGDSASETPAPEATPEPAPAGGQIPGAEKKLVAGILGILLGQFGVHKFILGYTQEGIIMAAVTVVGYVLTTFCIGVIGPLAMFIIGLIEGIMYLTKSDEEFVKTYITNKKPWF